MKTNNPLFMATWIPIHELLPEPETTVLMSFDDGSVSCYWQKWLWDDGEVGKYINDEMTGYRRVTAWMPLPDPYEEVRDESSL